MRTLLWFLIVKIQHLGPGLTFSMSTLQRTQADFKPHIHTLNYGWIQPPIKVAATETEATELLMVFPLGKALC